MPRGPKKGSPSNNPHGRPPKERSLTEAIKRALDVVQDGDTRTRKEIQAELLAQGVATAMVEFPDGRIAKLSVRDWIDLNFRLLAQVDGPPRQEIDLNQTSVVKGYFGFSPDEWDTITGNE